MKKSFIFGCFAMLLLVGYGSSNETRQTNVSDQIQSEYQEPFYDEAETEDSLISEPLSTSTGDDIYYPIDETYSYILYSDEDLEHPVIGFHAPAGWESNGSGTSGNATATRLRYIDFLTDIKNSYDQTIFIEFYCGINLFGTPFDESFISWEKHKLQIDGEYTTDTPIGEITIYQATRWRVAHAGVNQQTERMSMDGEEWYADYEEIALLSNGGNKGYVRLKDCNLSAIPKKGAQNQAP